MSFNKAHLIHIIQETDSTNNYANAQMVDNEVAEGTVFLTYNQTEGRGQLNNKWESESGKNLTFSLVLSPSFLEIREQFLISKVITLGICKALSFIPEVKIKWPNDIYVGNRKLGGILIENSIMSGVIKTSVAGIGINVNQEIFYSDAPNPVSLYQLTGDSYDLIDLLKKIIEEIKYYYISLRNDEVELINDLFLENMFRINENYKFKDDENEFIGRIFGVNEIGQLQIEDENNIRREYHFKEVEFII